LSSLFIKITPTNINKKCILHTPLNIFLFSNWPKSNARRVYICGLLWASKCYEVTVQKIIYGVKFCTEVWTLLKTASYIFFNYFFSIFSLFAFHSLLFFNFILPVFYIFLFLLVTFFIGLMGLILKLSHAALKLSHDSCGPFFGKLLKINIKILLKTSKIWSKIKILVKNQNFGQKLKFWSKIKIVVKN